jgi:hypothetical protein
MIFHLSMHNHLVVQRYVTHMLTPKLPNNVYQLCALQNPINYDLSITYPNHIYSINVTCKKNHHCHIYCITHNVSHAYTSHIKKSSLSHHPMSQWYNKCETDMYSIT